MQLIRSCAISVIGVAFVLVMVAAWPIGAHHTIPPGRFSDTFTDVQGVVKEVRLIAPHAWIILEVKGAKGETQTWPLEAASNRALEQIGVTPDYVRTGDTVKARCRVLTVVRGDYDCILGFLKARDGTVKDWSGNNAPVPADF
jgi:hypothetical protein